jgi:hypothetical protein
MLSSFIAAVYAWPRPQHFPELGYFALRLIVAESQWTQVQIKKSWLYLRLFYVVRRTVASPQKMLMRRVSLMKHAPSPGES